MDIGSTPVCAPTIGRVVHYHLIDTGKVVPAIIVDVLEEDRVDLFVMTSGRWGTQFEEGTWFERTVLKGSSPGRWEWPPLQGVLKGPGL